MPKDHEQSIHLSSIIALFSAWKMPPHFPQQSRGTPMQPAPTTGCGRVTVCNHHPPTRSGYVFPPAIVGGTIYEEAHAIKDLHFPHTLKQLITPWLWNEGWVSEPSCKPLKPPFPIWSIHILNGNVSDPLELLSSFLSQNPQACGTTMKCGIPLPTYQTVFPLSQTTGELFGLCPHHA